MSNENIIIKVPVEYSNIYSQLVERLTLIGLNVLTSCGNNPCTANYINCWTTFQIACLAYENGNVHSANSMVDYVVAKLNLKGGYVEKPVTEFSIDISNKTVGELSGSFIISIQSNSSWSAESNEPWLLPIPSTGVGNGGISITYNSNGLAEDRIGNIIFKCDDITKILTVSQSKKDADFIVIDISTKNITNSQTGFDINLSSNVEWSVSCDKSWVSAFPMSGEGNSIIDISCEENTSYDSRSAKVIISNGVISDSITIVQDASSAILNIDVSEISAYSNEGSKNIEVESNVSWVVSSNSPWVVPSISSGVNSDTITLNWVENTSSENRNAIISVIGGGITKTITLAQSNEINPAKNRIYWVESDSDSFDVSAILEDSSIIIEESASVNIPNLTKSILFICIKDGYYIESADGDNYTSLDVNTGDYRDLKYVSSTIINDSVYSVYCFEVSNTYLNISFIKDSNFSKSNSFYVGDITPDKKYESDNENGVTHYIDSKTHRIYVPFNETLVSVEGNFGEMFYDNDNDIYEKSVEQIIDSDGNISICNVYKYSAEITLNANLNIKIK